MKAFLVSDVVAEGPEVPDRGGLYFLDSAVEDYTLQAYAHGRGLKLPIPYKTGFRAGDVVLVYRTAEKSYWVGLVRAERGAALGMSTLELRPVEETEGGSLEKLLSAVPSRTRGHLKERVAGRRSAPLPPATWRATWRALTRNRPEISELVSKWRRPPLLREVSETVRATWAQERDAVRTVLDVAGLDPRILKGDLPPGSHRTFLDTLRQVEQREDIIIGVDARRFMGWKSMGELAPGAVTFRRGEDDVTIWNVNRTPIESVLGVDLIYYNHAYDAWVVVQYKRFQPGDEPIFRPSADGSLQRELASMRRVNGAGMKAHHPKEFRLYDSPCYLKFCEQTEFNPYETQPLPGIYLPLEHFDLLMSDPATLGEKGGRVLAKNRAGRWLTSSMFVGLVQRGLIGTKGVSSIQMQRLVEESLANRRLVVLAERRHVKDGLRES